MRNPYGDLFSLGQALGPMFDPASLGPNRNSYRAPSGAQTVDLPDGLMDNLLAALGSLVSVTPGTGGLMAQAFQTRSVPSAPEAAQRTRFDLPGAASFATKQSIPSIDKDISDAIGAMLRSPAEQAQASRLPQPDPRKALLDLINGYRPRNVRIEQPKLGSKDLLTGLLPVIALSLMNKDAGAAYGAGFLQGKDNDAQRQTQQNYMDAEREEDEYRRKLTQMSQLIDAPQDPDFLKEVGNPDAPDRMPGDPVLGGALASMGKLRHAAGWSSFNEATDLPRDEAQRRSFLLAQSLGGADANYLEAIKYLTGSQKPKTPVEGNNAMHQALAKLDSGIQSLNKLGQALAKEAANASNQDQGEYADAAEDLGSYINFLQNERNKLNAMISEWRQKNGFSASGLYLPDLIKLGLTGLPSPIGAAITRAMGGH